MISTKRIKIVLPLVIAIFLLTLHGRRPQPPMKIPVASMGVILSVAKDLI